MQHYYSPSSGWFYRDGMHHDIPEDAVPISADEHAALLAAQAQGLVILAGPDGQPITVDRPDPTLDAVASAKAREIRAGYDTALAGVLAGAEATATGVAVGSALMAVSDPEGLEYLVARLTARRVELEQALLAAQADAAPVPAVLAIVVSYPT
ncbi:phage tail protein [Nitratidesulfovibrio sp. HK-II]|uniref:phage tail protein n=1 Tax=Nitratidesulfovibrio sp. HK-II TaxID=2009266 RepID=UPI000E2F008E|nr:phage tail protein [Nitratidesulfovibrio sp. HK-II]GBO96121.1 putative tail fiber assembly protein p37 [Nitratidesulfovibrio sp. HK-II]